MSTATQSRPLPELILPKAKPFELAQNIGYSIAASKWATWVASAIYVLIFQARYFGRSLKYTWDNLATILHFGSVPWIGHWLTAYYDIGRHLFLRDDPEVIVAYAFVAIIVVKLKPLKDKTPFIDRIMIRLGMPSRYQSRPLPRIFRPGNTQGRHPETSPLQLIFLLPSMLLLALPGEILAAVVVFSAMALAHKYGHPGLWWDPAWLAPTAGWVPVVIGFAGGALWGHRPAAKVGEDVQAHFLAKRICGAYEADKIFDGYRSAHLSRAEARDQLTQMRRTQPGHLYPATYRNRYKALLAAMWQPVIRGRITTIALAAVLPALFILGVYGGYIREYGIAHGWFWMP